MALREELLGDILGDSDSSPLFREIVRRQERKREQIIKEREKFELNPVLAEKMLANLSRQFVPESKQEKLGVETSLGKVEKLIPKEDPRKLLGSATLAEFQETLPYAAEDVSPQELLASIHQKNMEGNKEAIYRAIRKDETSWFGLGSKKLAGMPGYESWKEKETEKREAIPLNTSNIIQGATWELAAYTASAVALGTAAVAAGVATAPVTVPALLAGGATAALLGAAGGTARSIIEGSEWAQDRPVKASLLSLVADAAITSKTMKLVPRLIGAKAEYQASALTVSRDPSAANILDAFEAEKKQTKELGQLSLFVEEELTKRIKTAKPATSTTDILDSLGIFETAKAQGLSTEEAHALLIGKLKKEQSEKLVGILKTGISQQERTASLVKEIEKISDVSSIEKLISQGTPLEDAIRIVKSEEDVLQRQFNIFEWPTKEIIAARKVTLVEAERPEKIRKTYETISSHLKEKGYSYSPEEIAVMPRATRKMLEREPDISAGIIKVRNEINEMFERKTELLVRPEKFLEERKLTRVTKGLEKETIQKAESSAVKMLLTADKEIVSYFNNAAKDKTVRELEELWSHTQSNALISVPKEARKGLRENINKFRTQVEDIIEKKKVEQTVNEFITWRKEHGISTSKKVEKIMPTEETPGKNAVIDLGEEDIGKDGVTRRLIEDATGRSRPFNPQVDVIFYKETEKGIEITEDALKNTDVFLQFTKVKREQLKKAAKGATKVTAIAGLAGIMIPLSDFFSPKEAEAGTITDMTRQIPLLIAEGLKPVYKNKNELFQAMKEAKLLLTPVSKEAPFTLPEAQRGLSIIPRLENIARFRKLPFNLGRVMSPPAQAQLFYGPKEGIEGFKNPMVELASRLTAAVGNTNIGLEVSGNILKAVNIKSEMQEVRKAMKPIVDNYLEDLTVAGHHYGWIKSLEEKSAKALKSAKKGMSKEEEDDILGGLDRIETELKMHKDELKKRQPVLDQMNNQWEQNVKLLAEKYSSTRVALAVEDIADFVKYPWLKTLVTKDEMVAAGRIRDMMDDYALRMMEVGEDPILSQAYVHHAPHPDANYKRIGKVLEGAGIASDEALRLAKFHSRSIHSKQMMPDIGYIMEHYLPDANRRIEIADFWKKGRPNGWDAHMKSDLVQNSEGLRTFWDNVNKGFDPVETTGVNKWSRLYYAAEVARLLAFSPSVALKHLIKMEANWSNFGIVESVKLLPSTTKVAMRSAIEEVAHKKLINPGLEDVAFKSFSTQRKLYRTMSDMETFEVPTSTWEKYLEKFNEKGSILIDSAERFDRAHSFVAATHMAVNKGMTPSQAAYAVMDTILKTNFLSGSMNPEWLRDPKIRMLFMFQGTPFKMLEQRAIQAMRTGKGISEASKELYGMVKNLRSDIRDGEYRFKTELIKDALTKEKDLFGTPVSQQFMRKMLILGTIVIGGKHVFDADMWHHVAHVPFIEPKGGEIVLQMNPIVTASLEAYNNKAEDEQELWFADFFSTWLKEGLIQQTVIKAARITRDDIPEIYRDSKIKYVFGIPAIKEEE